uniref:Uncharacterized protein n=1 Tax=Arundo donax TaxID=35708 RepID=A0A0A9FVQ7_ARUDO
MKLRISPSNKMLFSTWARTAYSSIKEFSEMRELHSDALFLVEK